MRKRFHDRRSIRLKRYDYTSPGAYFITLCARTRWEDVFSSIVNRRIILNDIGIIVRDCWNAIPEHFASVVLDEFVIMPDHFHGIIKIIDIPLIPAPPVGARHAVSQRGESQRIERFGKPVAGSIPTIIRSFKSAVTRRVNEASLFQHHTVWQKNYYEHVIRTKKSFYAIRNYIRSNPASITRRSSSSSFRRPRRCSVP